MVTFMVPFDEWSTCASISTRLGAALLRRGSSQLNARASAKVAVAVTRIGQGNFSNVKGVGSGVYEYTIDFGPGYRIYLGKDGNRLVILLGGGTKKRQQRDIATAIAFWQDYKRRKQ